MSIWGDLRKRSSGEVTRREDDVNLLDIDEFVDYLKCTYKEQDPTQLFRIGSWVNAVFRYISIPIEVGMPPLSLTIIINLQSNTINSLCINFESYPEIKSHLEAQFKCGYNSLHPNDDAVTNRFCINVLDTLLGIVDNPLLKKL